MTATYITKDGDTVDLIAWNYYGSGVARSTEQILEANRGLADYGPQLPSGLVITLPAIDTTVKTGGVVLWE